MEDIPGGNPEALIDSAVLLATDDMLRAQLRGAARAAVEPQSWEHVISNFEADLAAVANAPTSELAPALA